MSLGDIPEPKRLAYLARLRALSLPARLQLALNVTQRAKSLIAASLRARYPLETERSIQRRVAERLSGPRVAARAYGR